MGVHTATIRWTRNAQAPATDFTASRYSRAHAWMFDGGTTVPASASPHNVPAGTADRAGVDPEEAFVAAVSSCHMLWFLALAAKRGLVVEQYHDEADGVLERDTDGVQRMTRVTLRPHITWGGTPPDAATVSAVHDAAHHACYIANSIRSTVTIAPVA